MGRKKLNIQQKFVKIGGQFVMIDQPAKMRVSMCLVYPDSAPADWISRARRWHMPIAISPLHDKDTWDDRYDFVFAQDENGELLLDQDGNPVLQLDEEQKPVLHWYHHEGDLKKPHYHVMIAHEGGSTTQAVFQRIIKDIGGVIPPAEHMEVLSVYSMYRYFGHLDDPDKVQYDMKDACLLGGFDPVNYETYAQKNAPFKEVFNDIDKHKIRSYRSLVDHYRALGDDRLLYFVLNRTVAFKGAFSSDQEPGEIQRAKRSVARAQVAEEKS